MSPFTRFLYWYFAAQRRRRITRVLQNSRRFTK